MKTDAMEQLKQGFNEAMKLRDAGALQEALAMLHGVTTSELQVAVAEIAGGTHLFSHAHMQMGDLYKRLGDKTLSELCFRTATELSPKIELASLGRFHSLLHLGRKHEALEEMVRYLSLKDSPMYRELLADGYGSKASEADRPLIQRARELLQGYSGDGRPE